jgi:hypothetical protein
MKLCNRLFILLCLTGSCISSCSDEDTPNQKEKQLNKLSNTWVIGTAMMDGMDYSEEYSNFELTLSGSVDASVYTYAVLGRPEISPWLPGGTWSFGSDENSMITRDPETADELHMIYNVTDTQLAIEFSFAGSGYESARVKSVEGNWQYTFTKK